MLRCAKSVFKAVACCRLAPPIPQLGFACAIMISKLASRVSFNDEAASSSMPSSSQAFPFSKEEQMVTPRDEDMGQQEDAGKGANSNTDESQHVVDDMDLEQGTNEGPTMTTDQDSQQPPGDDEDDSERSFVPFMIRGPHGVRWSNSREEFERLMFPIVLASVERAEQEAGVGSKEARKAQKKAEKKAEKKAKASARADRPGKGSK